MNTSSSSANQSPQKMTTNIPIGFVGLGAMGTPIAAALIDAGHQLIVYDTNPAAVGHLASQGATPAMGVSELADIAEIVFTSLPTPAVVHEVVAGDGGLLSGSAMRTLVDLSTIGVSAAEQLANITGARQVGYLDAPVSGGVAGAEARTLAVMASGSEEVYNHIRPLLETFGRSVFQVGPRPGQGQLAKVLNNLLSATAVVATSEAMVMAAHAGLDLGTLLDVFNAGSARNTATTGKFPNHVLTGQYASGFRLALMAKDVELCLAEAREAHVPMVVGGLVQQLWTLAASRLGETADHTEIVRLYEEWTGLAIAATPDRTD